MAYAFHDNATRLNQWRSGFDFTISRNSKIPKVKIGSFTLSYYSAQWLRGEIDAGAEYNDRYPIVSMNYVEGTTSGTLKTEKVVNGKAVVWAQGNGYVPGHLISASFYISDR